MATSTLAASPSQPQMDRVEMDAAHALVGVLPSAQASHSEAAESASRPVLATVAASGLHSLATTAASHQASTSEAAEAQVEISSEDSNVEERPALGGGLDALAALASKEQAAYNSSPLYPHLVKNGVASASPSSSSDDDSEHAMPPPPPRFRRRRSASNPEGMEKWDTLNRQKGNRRHFVLPESILEEELAEASAAIREQGRKIPQQSIPEDEEVCDTDTPSTLNLSSQQQNNSDDTENLTPEELLRRARSRLLEDLSEGNMNGDKGMLTLPHSLAKYKEVYNKNGRIGIYTPSERAAIIAKFNKKRSRRVWNKKIRYNCRKSLADRRLRVKGRFVKRSEQEQLRKRLEAEQAAAEDGAASPESDPEQDEDMPDVNDPEAGFSPTEDQPYRRLRRHTIT